MAAIRTGDQAAFETLFRRYAESLYDFAYRYVGIREAAQEVVQELFASLWERRHTWDVPEAVASYLFRAVRNRALNALRDQRTATEFAKRVVGGQQAEADEVVVPDAEQQVEVRELAEAIEQAVQRLPARCQEVFRLNRYHHLSYAEVARVLDIAPKTVELHMARALAELRRRLRNWRS